VSEPLSFELSRAAAVPPRLPAVDVVAKGPSEVLSPDALRSRPPGLPKLSEPEIMRHYSRLASLNYSISENFYPLGSCTMKYNPVLN
jgi:glycine dehydrogenase subunit 2